MDPLPYQQTFTSDSPDPGGFAHLLSLAQPIQLAHRTLYELHTVATAVGKDWSSFRAAAIRYDLRGVILGWRWVSTEFQLARWLDLYPNVVTVKQKDVAPVNKLGPDQYVVQPIEAFTILTDGVQFIQPIELARVLGCDHAVLKNWLLKAGLDVKVVRNQVTAEAVVSVDTLCEAIEAKSICEFRRKRRPSHLLPGQVRVCSKCQGDGRVQVLGVPLSQTCEVCGGSGVDPRDVARET